MLLIVIYLWFVTWNPLKALDRKEDHCGRTLAEQENLVRMATTSGHHHKHASSTHLVEHGQLFSLLIDQRGDNLGMIEQVTTGSRTQLN